MLLVVECIGLERLHGWLAERWRLTSGARVALVAALLLVPTLAALPVAVHWRLRSVLERDVRTGLLRVRDLVTLDGLAAAENLLVAPGPGHELANMVDALRQMTAHGEPIFVYPTSPLIYLLAERSNPTRYEHLYPGSVPRDELIRLVQDPEQARVQTVVVSSYSLLTQQSTRGHDVVEEYLTTHFQESWRSAQYQILQRMPGP